MTDDLWLDSLDSQLSCHFSHLPSATASCDVDDGSERREEG